MTDQPAKTRGRPRKEEPRNILIKIRFSSSEIEALKLAAKVAGFDLSAFIRDAANERAKNGTV